MQRSNVPLSLFQEMEAQWQTALMDIARRISDLAWLWDRYMLSHERLDQLENGLLYPNMAPLQRDIRIMHLTQAMAEYSTILIRQAVDFKRRLDRFRIRYVYERSLNLSNALRDIGQRLQDDILMENWSDVFGEFEDLATSQLVETLLQPEVIDISSDTESDDPNDPDYEPER